MKLVLRIPSILVLLVVSFMAGCAAPSGTVKNTSALSISPSLSIDAILVETTSSSNGSDAERHRLADAILSGLNDTGLFKNVSTNRADVTASKGIKIFADINEIKKVSDTARTWEGAWAGRARILVQVTITDLASGHLVETFAAEGQSGKSAWAGTTDEAIHEAAGEIVAEAVKINAQTSQ
jgi:hypothetical protein